MSLPVILFWLALAVAVNVFVPQLDVAAKNHSVSLAPEEAPSLIAMKRIGKDFQQFDSNTTAMIVLEGRDRLGDEARRFYDTLIERLSEDKAHIQHIDDFWGDTLTAAGSQSSDGKAAYVELYLAGDQGGVEANESAAAVQRIVDSVPPPPGIKAYVTGTGPLSTDRRDYADRSLKRITGITFLVIAITLLAAYRSIATVLIVLFTVGIELVAVRGVISALATHRILGLSSFGVSALVALTIATSVDYLIFLIGRFQEARAAGEDREAAYYTMFHGTSHVVLGSGLTIAGAMFCLTFTRLPYLSNPGLPSVIGLLMVILASLSLAPAIITVASRFGFLESRRPQRTRFWRRTGTVVVRWPVPVLVAATLVMAIGLLSLPKYHANYNDRFYIPRDAPSNIGYNAAERHFPQARLAPELLMIGADHDLRNPTDMLVLDRIAKRVFHSPGVARTQTITRPLGTPIDHSSIPFQIGLQGTMTIQNLKLLKDSVADMRRITDELQHMIDITERIDSLMRQLTDVVHDMDADAKTMQVNTNELRDHLADFDDTWRPIRSYFYWERHCSAIPICWSLRSLLDGLDGVDRLSEDVGNLVHNLDQVDVIQPQLLAQLPQMIATMRAVKSISQTMASTFAGLVTQMEDVTRNVSAMGQAFDAAKNDDSFYLPPETFDNPDFQRGLTHFLSPDGKSARFIITHKGEPASLEGMSHIDPILYAADDAVKGTPLVTARIYLAGAASTYKDIHDRATYDLMIAVVASLCLIFVIVLTITSSVVAAAVIVGTVAGSLGSALGISILIWQHILHMPFHWMVLPLATIVMLAVGSDYNLLLVARFREEIGAGPKTGIIRSIANTGGVVTTAGVVFALTMGSMAASDLRGIAQFGTTVMIGLLFDIVVVRSFVMPSVATLLGRWFWWPLRAHTYATPRLARTNATG
nr:MMPL family transporter [Mycobacterium spongiae]